MTLLLSFGLLVSLVNLHIGFLQVKRRNWPYAVFNGGIAICLVVTVITKLQS
jgi:hypothetical protein